MAFLLAPLLALGATLDVGGAGDPTIQFHEPQNHGTLRAAVESTNAIPLTLKVAASSGATPSAALSIAANGEVSVSTLNASTDVVVNGVSFNQLKAQVDFLYRHLNIEGLQGSPPATPPPPAPPYSPPPPTCTSPNLGGGLAGVSYPNSACEGTGPICGLVGRIASCYAGAVCAMRFIFCDDTPSSCSGSCCNPPVFRADGPLYGTARASTTSSPTSYDDYIFTTTEDNPITRAEGYSDESFLYSIRLRTANGTWSATLGGSSPTNGAQFAYDLGTGMVGACYRAGMIIDGVKLVYYASNGVC